MNVARMLFLVASIGSVPLAVTGLRGCDRSVSDADQAAFEKTFNQEAVLIKTCGVDPGISSLPLRVYQFNNQLWFKDISRWRPIAAGKDNVCDVLDFDAQERDRQSRRVRDGWHPGNQWFTWRLRLVGNP
jgi:hypothetical protein